MIEPAPCDRCAGPGHNVVAVLIAFVGDRGLHERHGAAPLYAVVQIGDLAFRGLEPITKTAIGVPLVVIKLVLQEQARNRDATDASIWEGTPAMKGPAGTAGGASRGANSSSTDGRKERELRCALIM